MTPKATRPHMPGYGIRESRKGLLPWKWAAERLTKGRNYWISTTRPDGRPHTMPVWGVWVANAFYFSTSRTSRKGRNLAANPQCVICSDRGHDAVVLEGSAEEVTDTRLFKKVDKVYFAKYKWHLDREQGPLFVVRPAAAFGFIESNDFTATATRWKFEGDHTS